MRRLGGRAMRSLAELPSRSTIVCGSIIDSSSDRLRRACALARCLSCALARWIKRASERAAQRHKRRLAAEVIVGVIVSSARVAVGRLCRRRQWRPNRNDAPDNDDDDANDDFKGSCWRRTRCDSMMSNNALYLAQDPSLSRASRHKLDDDDDDDGGEPLCARCIYTCRRPVAMSTGRRAHLCAGGARNATSILTGGTFAAAAGPGKLPRRSSLAAAAAAAAAGVLRPTPRRRRPPRTP